jgi:hypothetical protein
VRHRSERRDLDRQNVQGASTESGEHMRWEENLG